MSCIEITIIKPEITPLAEVFLFKKGGYKKFTFNQVFQLFWCKGYFQKFKGTAGEGFFARFIITAEIFAYNISIFLSTLHHASAFFYALFAGLIEISCQVFSSISSIYSLMLNILPQDLQRRYTDLQPI